MHKNTDTASIRVTQHHYEMYVKLLAQYGLSIRAKYEVNTIMLNELKLEDTSDNRQWISNKFRIAMPGNPRCKPEFEQLYTETRIPIVNEVKINRQQQLKLDENLIDKVLLLIQMEKLTPQNVSNLSILESLRLVKEYVNARGNIGELEIKLHGISTDDARRVAADIGHATPEAAAAALADLANAIQSANGDDKEETRL